LNRLSYRLGSGSDGRKRVQGELEPECLGLAARDTFHVGKLKGVGLVYRRIFIDTYAKAGFAKLHNCKTPIMAADLELAGVLPFHAESGSLPPRVLADRGTE
jgi:hypothetical protein